MYGTLMRAHVKPEDRDALLGVLGEGRSAKGFRVSYVLFPDDRDDEIVAAVIFDDEASYRANAHDPATEEWYGRFRALLRDDPEWSDGTWMGSD